MMEDAKPILVIGGGISGMTAALEAAEVGYRVILVEKEACLGGRVVRMHRYFPKMCPPTCGFEINVRRIRQNKRVTVHTLSTVEEATGSAGNFRVRIHSEPRYVTGTHSLEDGVADQLTSERDDEFNYGMNRTKALYRPSKAGYPAYHVVDREALSDADAKILVEACPPGSIDLDMKPRDFEVDASTIILATGWRPYDASRIDNLGFGRCANVITNVMMERLAARDGPTGGAIVRPSDGKPAENVAFVQCAGSRDDNHLPYCSAVCCMASLKQVRYLREASETSRATVYYIDIRTVGSLEKFYFGMLDDENVTFTKGKVAEVTEDADTGDLLLAVEDTLTGETLHSRADLVVLATGMVPNEVNVKLPFELERDEYGFLVGGQESLGVIAAGSSKHPCDVSRCTKDSTAAALKAIHCLCVEE
jgi:quinone-modifying oxidoreductase, subunit QmoA